jgi:hypothetical protein
MKIKLPIYKLYHINFKKSWYITIISLSWDKFICPAHTEYIVANLLLQGASFNGGTLQQSSPEAHKMMPAPSVCIGFVSMEESKVSTNNNSCGGNAKESSSSIEVPMFSSSSREEFLNGVFKGYQWRER